VKKIPLDWCFVFLKWKLPLKFWKMPFRIFMRRIEKILTSSLYFGALGLSPQSVKIDYPWSNQNITFFKFFSLFHSKPHFSPQQTKKMSSFCSNLTSIITGAQATILEMTFFLYFHGKNFIFGIRIISRWYICWYQNYAF
jgi:hypothetical protein